MATLGSNLRKYRLERGLTQEDLAAKTGLNSVYISYLESGKRGATTHSLKKIAKALDVSMEELFKEA